MLKRWTDDEDVLVKACTTKEDEKRVAATTGRSVLAVALRRKKFGILFRAAHRRWTPQEDKILLAKHHKHTSREIGIMLGRAMAAVHRRLYHYHGIKKLRHFSPEEDAIIAADAKASIPVMETANKLGRSWGVIRQRSFKLHIKRDFRKTLLVRKFGLEAVTLHPDPTVARQMILDELKRKRELEDAEYAALLQEVLVGCADDIAAGRATRQDAFKSALVAGCTLEMIGQHFGITRERVRQVIYHILPGHYAKGGAS